MNLSTRSRYGARALVELAAHSGDGPVHLEALAGSQDIPLRYLAAIVRDLKRAGLVRSVRGAHGGYLMGRKPAEVRLLDVVRCLEGSLATVPCVNDPGFCDRRDQCVTREVWAKVDDAIAEVLGSVTLQDLVDRRAEMKSPSAVQV